MKTIGLRLSLLTLLLLMVAAPADPDMTPRAFASFFFRGTELSRSQESSGEKPSYRIVKSNRPSEKEEGKNKSLNYSTTKPVKSSKNNSSGLGREDNKIRGVNHLKPVLVKNISVFPGQVTNDGSGSAEIRCNVFTPNDQARIESVKISWPQGVRSPAALHLLPDPDNILSPTAEGEYAGTLHIPWMMDSGILSFQIIAVDSLGLTGQRDSEFKISYRPRARLPGIGSPEFQKILESISGQPFVPHNRIEVLDTGEIALSKRLSLIENARHQVNLQTYTYDAQGLCKQISDAISKKVHEGIEVNILLNTDSQIPTSPINTLRLKLQAARLNLLMFSADTVQEKKEPLQSKPNKIAHWLQRIRGERRADGDNGTPPELPEWLSQFKGPGGLPALPLLDYGSHEKIQVVDGKKAILGGRNLEDKYFTHWIDLDLLLEGPVVNQIQQGYLRSCKAFSRSSNSPLLLQQQLFNGKPQPDGVPALFVQSFPWENEYRTLLSLVAALQACSQRFYASSQYLVLPESLLLDALLDAARRGVDIRILMNSFQTSREATFSSSYFASVNYIEPLLAAGIRVYEINGTDEEDTPQPYYHVKEFLFDGNLAAIGSFNLSLRSCYLESENLVLIHDKDFCSHREEAFLQRIHTQASELTAKKLDRLRAEHRRKIELAKHIDLLF